MPFTRTQVVREYVPAPMPKMDGSDKQHYENELKAISRTLNNLVKATREMQNYLETLP